jgi:hypothetical protein
LPNEGSNPQWIKLPPMNEGRATHGCAATKYKVQQFSLRSVLWQELEWRIFNVMKIVHSNTVKLGYNELG